MLSIYDLRCEYKKNPIGIDVKEPRLSWKIKSEARNVQQTSYEVLVSEDKDFINLLWDSGKIESCNSIHVEYNGPSLKSNSRYYYKVKVYDNKGNESDWSNICFWETAFMNSEEWQAQWIAAEVSEEDTSSPLLRKVFEVSSKIKQARIYATSLGLYELYLNGERVSDWLFTPGWTSYNKRLQYQTYDVTDFIKGGKNALGAILGNGWYKGNLAWQNQKNVYGSERALLVELHICYEDGSSEIIRSDESWKASSSPIGMSELYHGEVYDARLEQKGWNTAEFDDSSWTAVKLIQRSREGLVAQENVPTRAIEEIKPIQLIKTPAGETVIDMGQNMVGYISFSVKGKAGDKIILQHAEVLDKEGNFYTDNLRSAKQTIEYTLKGGERENYKPYFTFQGFRYVKIVEFPGEPSLENFTGVVIHSDMEATGSFECSNPLVNQLQHNILWGEKGNFLDVPTDCPQRDERLGWTGDAQVFIRTASFNMNTATFFTKWLRDLKADQREDGGVPFVVPHVLNVDSYSSAAWGDAAVICPWTIYLCYGDKRILEEQYGSMKAWVEYIRQQGENEYLWNTGFHFGDWLALDAKENSYIGSTPKDYIATAFYAYSTSLLAKSARIIGKTEEAEEYEALYKNILKAFREEFVTSTGRLVSPTQTACVLALMFDLVEEKDKKRVIDTLIGYLEESKYHLTTGFVGTPYLCKVLSDNGHTEAAYKLLLQTDYPSWLYQVTKGATTIWEHWDGIKTDGSFWSRDMNSFNHYAYGAIGDWLYRTVAGIELSEETPGYKHTLISPHIHEGMSYAKASIESMYGLVSSHWERDEKNINLNVQIPANTLATVEIEDARIEDILEGGRSIGTAEGVISCIQIEKRIKIEIGSGEYHFSIIKN
jgi:alpha-L-rhamnosidase